MTRKSPANETTELEVLKVLWDHGPGTVREINARLRNLGRRLAYTTVLTKLQRLESKGFVVSDKRDVAHVFRAAVSRERFLKRRLKDLANEVCDGTATPLVMALVEESRFTPEEIDRLRRLLNELDT